MVCIAEPQRIELSPSHRTDSGFTLVSISHSGRVTTRFDEGRLADATPGQLFEARDHKACGTVELLSADTSSGRVVLEAYSVAFHPIP